MLVLKTHVNIYEYYCSMYFTETVKVNIHWNPSILDPDETCIIGLNDDTIRTWM